MLLCFENMNQMQGCANRNFMRSVENLDTVLFVYMIFS